MSKIPEKAIIPQPIIAEASFWAEKARNRHCLYLFQENILR